MTILFTILYSNNTQNLHMAHENGICAEQDIYTYLHTDMHEVHWGQGKLTLQVTAEES